MISGSWVLYSTNYFNLEPHYLCWNEGDNQSDNFTCFADKVPKSENGPVFCGNNKLRHEYNFELPGTIHGWVEQYNLTCEGQNIKGYIGSCFSIGCFVGSFILPVLSDQVGRKPMFILGLILYTITLFGVQFSKTYPFLMAWLVLGGISETGRYYVAYVYAIEIFSSKG